MLDATGAGEVGPEAAGALEAVATTVTQPDSRLFCASRPVLEVFSQQVARHGSAVPYVQNLHGTRANSSKSGARPDPQPRSTVQQPGLGDSSWGLERERTCTRPSAST